MKEKDIRSRDIQDRYLALCEQDAAQWLAREAEFVEVDCPACASPDRRPAFVKQGYRYSLCGGCGTLYLSRRPTEAMLIEFNSTGRSAAYWAGEFYPQCAEKRRASVYAPRAGYVKELEGVYGKTFRRLVDVGTGYGVFVEELAKVFPGAEVKGVEPGADLAAVCRTKGLDVFEGTAAQAAAFRGRFDFASCFEVLEHVFSPLALLEEVAALLGPGGVLFANTLGCEGFDIQVMWERHRNVYPINHINILSIRGFQALFERAGLGGVRVTTPGRLDVDILRSQMAAEDRPRFLRTMFARGDDALVARFQQFLAENQLSSHVWVVAQKA